MNNEKIDHICPRSENLEKELALSHKEIALLRKENKQQGETIQQTKNENEELKITINALVAKNIRAKPNKPDSVIKRKHSKHARTSRKRPVHIDNKTEVDQKSCHVCGNKLSKIVHKYTRIVEDIIPAQVCNTEYTISRRYCKCCKKTITPKIHTALPNERFGIRLAALLIVLKTLGLSYQKISQLLEMIYGIHMNESTINHAVKKTATAFGPLYEQMIRDLKTELNIHGDETSWRINGKNHWLWAFVGKWTTIYEIDKSRGRIAPMRMLKGYTGNITSDSWSAWNYVGNSHQRCHVHYMREIHETLQYKNPKKEFIAFGKCLKKILNDSHDAVNIHDKSDVIHKLERRLSSLLSKKYTEKNCIRFVKRLKREQDMLFTFLKTGTDSHNNTAERAIRPNVVIRKITNGHRTDDGATSHKILMSVKETCRQRNLNFHDYMMQYLVDGTSKL